MNLSNFSLNIKKRVLLDNVTLSFDIGVNHLLGKNGTGKSCFAKALYGIFPYFGTIDFLPEPRVLIASYTNIPLDLSVRDVLYFSSKNGNEKIYEFLFENLAIDDIPLNSIIKNLSDGQRQKLKLLFFLVTKSKLVILDEFTNALDKSSCMHFYDFLHQYYIENEAIIINITHNISDVEYMYGKYFLLENHTITPFPSKNSIIASYMRG